MYPESSVDKDKIRLKLVFLEPFPWPGRRPGPVGKLAGIGRPTPIGCRANIGVNRLKGGGTVEGFGFFPHLLEKLLVRFRRDHGIHTLF